MTMNVRHWRGRVLLIMGLVMSILIPACGTGKPSDTAITVYSATGLSAWYKVQFEKFTRDTGVKVTLFEAGSGEVVSRVNSGAVWERVNSDQSVPPADLLVTIPPFIQKAEKAGLLQPGGADTTGIPSEQVGPEGKYVPIANTALCFIANPAANPPPLSWQDLLSSQFKGKLQYSSPGETGDGTALLILLKHLMGREGALDYLSKLGRNNVGPASSTASLMPKVNSGVLLIANGDVQMNVASIKNDGSKFTAFFPAMPDGVRTTVALPYTAGVTAGSQRPDDARKLLAFLLSEEAQTSLASDAFGIPVRLSDQTAGRSAVLPPAGVLNGVQLWTPDWNTVSAELDGDLAAYRNAVR